MKKPFLGINDIETYSVFQNLLPPLSWDELEQLRKNIIENGLLDPIKIWFHTGFKRWMVIDGHNRLSIMRTQCIPWNPETDYSIIYHEELPDEDAVINWMIDQQLGRRNLDVTTRYQIVQKHKDIIEKKAKENQSKGGKGLSNLPKVNSRKIMAEKVGISEGSYRKLDKIMNSMDSELVQRVRNKEISLDGAYRELEKKQKEKSVKKEKSFEEKIEDIDKKIQDTTEKRNKAKEDIYKYKAKKLDLIFNRKQDVRIYHEWNGIMCSFYVSCGNIFDSFYFAFVFTEEEKQKVLNALPKEYHEIFENEWSTAIEESKEKQSESYVGSIHDREAKVPNIDKKVYKRIYYVLSQYFHPDTPNTGDEEMMKVVTALKEAWGL